MVIFAGCNRQSRARSRMTNEPPPTSWDIYLARHAPAKWIRTVEAADADAAIKEPAEKFNVQDIKKLIAVRRPGRDYACTPRPCVRSEGLLLEK